MTPIIRLSGLALGAACLLATVAIAQVPGPVLPNAQPLPGGQPLDMAPPAPPPAKVELPQVELSPETIADIERLAELKRKTLELEEEAKQAKIALDVWGTLYNNEHAKNWREREDKKREEQAGAAEVSMAGRDQTAALRERPLDSLPAALRAALTGGIKGRPNTGVPTQVTANGGAPSARTAEPVVTEISGGTAYVYVEGEGEVAARVGAKLPTGHKVTSISSRGVEVELNGRANVLGFGRPSSR